MNYAVEITNRLDTIDVFRCYGFEPNNKGFICCPFHNEKTPSCKVYNGNRGYYCFGCGEHGDIITFVQKLFNLSFQEALKKLNTDFNLGLPIGEKMSRRKQIEMNKRAFDRSKERKKAINEHKRLNEAFLSARNEFIRLEQNKRNYAPKSQNQPLHPLFIEALQKLDYVNSLYDITQQELYEYEHRNKS